MGTHIAEFYKAKLIDLAGRTPMVAAALRRHANRFGEGSIVTIRSGYAAGYTWKRSHRYVNGYWTGQYELAIQQAIVRELLPGDTFFDVGANAGFFTLVAARRVGANGRVVAFEPLPDNAESVATEIRLNDLQTCHLSIEALSDHVGTASFCCGTNSSTAHLGKTTNGEPSIDVKLNTLDNAVHEWGPPALVKMDIEGAEVDALRGAPTLLRSGHSTFLIELHNEQCKTGVKAILGDAGYTFFDILGRRLPEGEALPHHVLAKKTMTD